MSEITRAEFDELRQKAEEIHQKVEEIHRMLVNMGGQPNVVMVQPMAPQTEDATVTLPIYRGQYPRALWRVKP